MASSLAEFAQRIVAKVDRSKNVFSHDQNAGAPPAAQIDSNVQLGDFAKCSHRSITFRGKILNAGGSFCARLSRH